MKKQELSDTLIKFLLILEKKISFHLKNIEEIIPEEIAEKLFDSVLICNSLKNSIYKNIIGSFKWHYEDGNFPEIFLKKNGYINRIENYKNDP